MSTIKISQLTSISQLSSNTSNTLLVAVDTASGITGKITAKIFGDGLYAYNTLSVGTVRDNYPNTLAQFTGSANTYAQLNIKNTNSNGSIDYIATADTGTDSTNFIDLGINNSTFSDPTYSSMSALDGYLYVNGNGNNLIGNLIIGTPSPNTETRFISGGLLSSNVIAKITNTGLKVVSGKRLIFGDDTYQTTAASPVNYTQGIYDLANTNTTAISTANTFLQSNDAITLAAAKAYALANTNNIITAKDLTVSSNLIANGTVSTQKGFVYTPNVVSGSTTTLTLDIANTSLLKCNSSTGLTVTLSNYTPGKVTQLWFVNSAASPQTVNHGCLANNSTTGTSSFSLASGHSAHLQYFALNNTLSEVFVSISYQ